MTHRRECADRKHLTDEELEAQIAGCIGTHPMLWGAMIVIEARHGCVTLTGVVPTEHSRHLATFLARANGAIGVHNRLCLDSDLQDRDTPRDPRAA